MHVRNASFRFPEIQWKETTIAICKCVLKVLKVIATTIYQVTCWSCTQIKEWYLEFRAQRDFGRYEFMPRNNIGFLQTAIDNFREELPESALVQFNRQFKEQDADVYPLIGIAAARAFLFSGFPIPQNTYFSDLSNKQPKLYKELLQARLLFSRLELEEKKKYMALGDSTEITATQEKIYRPVLSAGSQLIQIKSFNVALSYLT